MMIAHGGMLSFPSIAFAACIAWVLLCHRRAYIKGLVVALDGRAISAIRRVGVEQSTVFALALLALLFFCHLSHIGPSNGAWNRTPVVAGRWETFLFDGLYSIVLYFLYRSLCVSRFPRIVRVALVVIPVIMYGVAVLTTNSRSADLYGYVAYGQLGWAAYAPPSVPFTGSFAELNAPIAAAWNRLEPAPYGPLFLAFDWLIAGHASSFMQARIELRLANVAAIGVCLLAMRRLGFGVPVLAVFCLDPEVIFNYVADGHNDILAVASILGAMALYGRSRSIAILGALTAGAIKAPYIVPALLVASVDESRARRVWIAATILVGTLLVSAVGGPAYLAALTWHGANNAMGQPGLQRFLHGLAALAVLLIVAFAVRFRRTLWPGALLFPELFAAGYAWYGIAGLPYAVARRKGCAAFLILLPLLMFFFRVTNAFG
jgi:hypothetical protein